MRESRSRNDITSITAKQAVMEVYFLNGLLSKSGATISKMDSLEIDWRRAATCKSAVYQCKRVVYLQKCRQFVQFRQVCLHLPANMQLKNRFFAYTVFFRDISSTSACRSLQTSISPSTACPFTFTGGRRNLCRLTNSSWYKKSVNRCILRRNPGNNKDGHLRHTKA